MQRPTDKRPNDVSQGPGSKKGGPEANVCAADDEQVQERRALLPQEHALGIKEEILVDSWSWLVKNVGLSLIQITCVIDEFLNEDLIILQVSFCNVIRNQINY